MAYSGRLAFRERGLAPADTPILAFPHKGRRDPLASIQAWLPVADLASIIWIPDFAGMTGGEMGEGDLPLAIRTWLRAAVLAETVWIPDFAGMTG